MSEQEALAREKLLAAVDVAQRLLDEARTLLDTADAAHATTIQPAPKSEPEWLPDWGRLGDAQEILDVSRGTALSKVRRFGLGHVVDRRWQVDLNRVRALLAKEPFPPL